MTVTKKATDSPFEQNEVPEAKNVAGRSVPTEPVKSESPARKQEEEIIPQSYVWLANGQVLLVNDEDVPPGPSGGFGHFQRGGMVHQIVAVYPREEKAEK